MYKLNALKCRVSHVIKIILDKTILKVPQFKFMVQMMLIEFRFRLVHNLNNRKISIKTI